LFVCFLLHCCLLSIFFLLLITTWIKEIRLLKKTFFIVKPLLTLQELKKPSSQHKRYFMAQAKAWKVNNNNKVNLKPIFYNHAFKRLWRMKVFIIDTVKLNKWRRSIEAFRYANTCIICLAIIINVCKEYFALRYTPAIIYEYILLLSME